MAAGRWWRRGSRPARCRARNATRGSPAPGRRRGNRRASATAAQKAYVNEDTYKNTAARPADLEKEIRLSAFLEDRFKEVHAANPAVELNHGGGAITKNNRYVAPFVAKVEPCRMNLRAHEKHPFISSCFDKSVRNRKPI